MLINKSNYELFALDYIEGNLGMREKKAMKTFLQAHPDLEAEIESMQVAMFTFEAEESIVYENKVNLLKEENETPVVFMQPRRWYGVAAAAAIAILLIGFGVGYFAGSLSSEGEVIMAANKSVTEEGVSPTSPLIEQDETIVKVKELIDSKAIIPNQPKPKIKKQITEKPLMIQEHAASALATLESEKATSIESPKIEAELIIEGLKPIERRTEVVAITPLPRLEVNITINSIQASNESPAIVTDYSKDLIVSLNSNDRLGNQLSKIKGFLGKLPFEDATLEAFVPTYFANAD